MARRHEPEAWLPPGKSEEECRAELLRLVSEKWSVPLEVARWAEAFDDTDEKVHAYAGAVMVPRAAKMGDRAALLMAYRSAREHRHEVDPVLGAVWGKLLLRILADPCLQWEKVEAAARLGSPDVAFRDAVANAMSRCVYHQVTDGTDEWVCAHRAVWLEIAGRAEAALKDVEAFSTAVDKLGSLGWENVANARPSELQLPPVMDPLRAWAAIARQQADLWGMSDGRRRSKMKVFRSLIDQLADAFETATGRKATMTWKPEKSCYEGSFLGVVDAVILVLSDLLREAGCLLAYSNTAGGRGTFIARALRNRAQRLRSNGSAEKSPNDLLSGGTEDD